MNVVSFLQALLAVSIAFGFGLVLGAAARRRPAPSKWNRAIARPIFQKDDTQ